jgi:D-alanyl-D-alanine dipeptidase
MASKGFVVFDGEWWHFEYGTRRWAAITGGTPRFGPAGPAD